MAEFIPFPPVSELPSFIVTPHGTIYDDQIYDEEDGHFEPQPSEETTVVPLIVTPESAESEFDLVLFSNVMGVLGCICFLVTSICFLKRRFPG